MAQRSISSFFFKGPAPVGAGAPATAVAADATSPPAAANDAAAADAPEIGTLKRKREASGDEGPRRDQTPGTGTPGRSDDHGVSTTGASVSPETRAEMLGATAERDPRRRDAMRERLGETVGKSESKRREVRERFKWLDAKHVVDDKGRDPSHAEYDANTVRVPPDLKLSASQKQYWDVKSKFRDVVLFFKVGKFYELYEDDAEIGCAALDWKMTVSGVGHCRQVGCPESGVDAATAELVRRGYKVGRIEQMETAAEAKARTGSATAVIRRELLSVTSPATAVDGDLPCVLTSHASASSMDATAAHLLVIAEGLPTADADAEARAKENDESSRESSGEEKARPTEKKKDETTIIGFAFLDAAAGTLRVGSFADDASRVALSTLLTQTSPVEVLVRRGALGVSAATETALAKTPRAPKTTRVSEKKGDGVSFFPSTSNDADEELTRFFRLNDKDGVCDALVTRLKHHPLETKCAVAALASHLTRLRNTAPLLAAEIKTHSVYAPNQTARLDGPTIRHLELLCGPDGLIEGSLLSKLDRCVTAGGSRTLRKWLTAPLRLEDDIGERQDAVAFFGGFERLERRGSEGEEKPETETACTSGHFVADAAGRLQRALRRVPDLERCVGRARAASAATTADPRALPFPLAEKRHARRVAALAAAVAAADAVVGALRDLEDVGAYEQRAPALIKRMVRAAAAETLAGGASDALEDARAALDWGTRSAAAAKQKGSKVAAAAAAPALKSTRAPETQARLCSSPEASVEILREAEKETDALLERFLEHAPRWSALATASAELDALCALAAFGADAAGPTCRPRFVRLGAFEKTKRDAPVFEACALWNPCAVASAAAAGVRTRAGEGLDKAVPNDVSLGGVDEDGNKRETAVLLTGPNMGGKSTLLRAACVAVVLAQMGAPVPCVSLTLSAADVVFTRLGGASDRLDAGESTFLVECAEAASILRGATRDSFVVLDELGRGTSTFDGYAVAFSALHALAERVKCRLLFATHYHALSREFGKSHAVALRHMAAKVGADAGDRSIFFLYALREGSCPKSYGTNVAALAGVPEKVLVRATQAAAAMERKLAGAFAFGEENGKEKRSLSLTPREEKAFRRALDARDAEALGDAWASLR
jgi:DNA mismatch repair protein MSH6